eukprot:SAG31_NODE_32529_length_354_cov_1.600000_1_plen_84_part_00
MKTAVKDSSRRDAELAWQELKRVRIPNGVRRFLTQCWPDAEPEKWNVEDTKVLMQQLAEDQYRVHLKRWTRRHLRRHHLDAGL